MLEIELKYQVPAHAPVAAILAAWRAAADAPIQEADHYFNAPDRDFARTDEALRLRRIGPKNLVTYKGPKQPGLAKSRTEIEVPLAEGDEAAEKFTRLLTSLGYQPVAIVRKRRTVHRLTREGFRLEVCLDEVADLGQFVEVEIVALAEQKSQAEQVVQAAARELGLTRPEPRAYLQLLLETRTRN